MMFRKLLMISTLFTVISSVNGLFDIFNIWTLIMTLIDGVFEWDKMLLTFTGVSDDIFQSTPDLIKNEGYPVEEHVVQTEDGFILTMHRIPGSPRSSNTHKGTVLMLHGFSSSSADWIVIGKENGLGYILADHGYDVWLGNFRGNKYSSNHTTLSTSDEEFWDFSWHEMGMYDISAMIAYITDDKKVENLLVIGHSMGPTAFFVTACERPEIAAKVRAMFSLAPLAFLDHMRSTLKLLAPFIILLEPVVDLFTHGKLLEQTPLLRLITKFLCAFNGLEEDICYNFLYASGGADKSEINYNALPQILGHELQGASLKTGIHYAQLIMSGHFRQFDYGMSKNLDIYNNSSPPDYDFSKINVPVALFYSDGDLLVDLVDLNRLYEKLPMKLEKYKVNDPKFTHQDYVWGKHVRELVYKKLISMMKPYTL